ncbi:MAG: class I SAM-dependent methyltransferase [Candidatus Nanopelagicales bacterium]
MTAVGTARASGCGIALRVPPPQRGDLAPPQITAAMLAQVGPLPTGWSTVRRDACALPFGAHTFDAVVASYVLHLLSAADLPVALAELRRVLRPGPHDPDPDPAWSVAIASSTGASRRHGPHRGAK